MRTLSLLKPERDAELDDMANAVFHANKTLGKLFYKNYMYKRLHTCSAHLE